MRCIKNGSEEGPLSCRRRSGSEVSSEEQDEKPGALAPRPETSVSYQAHSKGSLASSALSWALVGRLGEWARRPSAAQDADSGLLTLALPHGGGWRGGMVETPIAISGCRLAPAGRGVSVSWVHSAETAPEESDEDTVERVLLDKRLIEAVEGGFDTDAEDVRCSVVAQETGPRPAGDEANTVPAEYGCRLREEAPSSDKNIGPPQSVEDCTSARLEDHLMDKGDRRVVLEGLGRKRKNRLKDFVCVRLYAIRLGPWLREDLQEEAESRVGRGLSVNHPLAIGIDDEVPHNCQNGGIVVRRKVSCSSSARSAASTTLCSLLDVTTAQVGPKNEDSVGCATLSPREDAP